MMVVVIVEVAVQVALTIAVTVYVAVADAVVVHVYAVHTAQVVQVCYGWAFHKQSFALLLFLWLLAFYERDRSC
jgi:hypothetical protein